MSARKAFVAGQFYPAGKAELRQTIDEYLSSGEDKQKPIALMVPHAGYIYSGAIAGAAYSGVEVPDTVVLIGPNHTGLGAGVAVADYEGWETPRGLVKTNTELTDLIAAGSEFTKDNIAHANEHSLEVQLPFLQTLNPAATIVAITVMPFDFDDCARIGAGVARAIKEYGQEILIVVSSDMNHYESDRVSREKDQMAIAQLLHMDSAALLKVCKERAITMCGVVPMAIGMEAAKELGATNSVLTGYATSGDVSQDREHVVGYAGIMIS
jgi:hypothetical protein